MFIDEDIGEVGEDSSAFNLRPLGPEADDEEVSAGKAIKNYTWLEMRKIRAKLAAKRQNRIPAQLKKQLEEYELYRDPLQQKPPVAYRTVADFPNENLPDEILQRTGQVSQPPDQAVT